VRPELVIWNGACSSQVFSTTCPRRKNSYEFGHDRVGNETVGMQTLNVAVTARD